MKPSFLSEIVGPAAFPIIVAKRKDEEFALLEYSHAQFKIS